MTIIKTNTDLKKYIKDNKEKILSNAKKIENLSVDDEWINDDEWDEIYYRERLRDGKVQ